VLELTTENLADYLRERRWVGDGPVRVRALTGGVSNAVLRVETPERAFVVKQSRPQLRTRDAWFSDIDRVFRELEVMRALRPLLPAGVVPEVLHEDRDNYAFAMTAAPEPARPWKELLLAGETDAKLAGYVGAVLGRIHEMSARLVRGFMAFADRFADRGVYVQLRVNPFYRRVQERRPEVAAAVAPLIGSMLSLREALCHGDYTPKNMLVHDGGFTLVDYETAHLGDPTMDLGLFLTHLVLKAFRDPARRAEFLRLTEAFWEGYAAEAHFAPFAELQRRGIAHQGVCLLARIDGTSPVEYLPEETKREAVRNLGRKLLLDRVESWADVTAAIEAGGAS
jgi:5-methylthioribose kinase